MPPQRESDVLTVSALTTQIKRALEGQFPNVWVAGEVSKVTRHSSGHMYIDLKDANSQLPAVMYRGSNMRLKFDPRVGMEVLARGRIGVYEPQGKYQFSIEELQPKGVGAAEIALRQLKEKLLVKGYFDPRRKKPLPRFPRRVGLVTSPTGAAIRDMLELFAQRWPVAEVIVQPSRVQGEGAAAELANGLRVLNTLHAKRKLGFDAIVIGRGGGSAEDLSAFNDERLADAIFASVVPVVSAVGHEIDVTIADLVADYRAETPSAAVVALTPQRDELIAELRELKRRAGETVLQRIAAARRTVDDCAARPVLRRPLQRIRDLEQRLDDTSGRFDRAARAFLFGANARLDSLAAQLDSLSPLNVLKRGYSLTLTAEGRLVRSSAAIQTGDELVTRLHDGEIVSRVVRTAGRT